MLTQVSLLKSIGHTDRQMMALLDGLSDTQLSVPCSPGINPPIWEIGHAAYFYEFFLLRRLYGSDPIMPGYDTVWDSFEIPHRERWQPGVVPDKSETLAYYRRVLGESIDRLSSPNNLSDEELYLGQYVVAHQCMHLESLIWCRQTLAYPPPPWSQFADPNAASPPPPDNADAEIPGGTYFIGVPSPAPGQKSLNFSFDNERPGFPMDIAPFRISRTLVSQGEFLAFVEDRGYQNPDLWSAGGKYYLRALDRSCPAYWQKRDGQWTVRRFDQIEPLSPHQPVLHLSFWEAEAFCRWARRRLPTEFEWEAAARTSDARKFPWGNSMEAAAADLDSRLLGTAPVTAFPAGATPHGCLQMIGTAWEWTTDQYLPFDGFCVDMYAYMSTLQFGTHKTARGGSCATSASLIRSTYRQAYHPDRSDIFTGFRTCALQD